jgi:hypothetical protein
MPHHASLRNTCLALVGCLALGAAGLTAPVPAWGQASGMGGIGSSQTITARAKVQAIDLATREVTLVGPEGVFTIHAGDAVRNLDKIKVGDTVVATITPRSCWAYRRREPRFPTIRRMPPWSVQRRVKCRPVR